MKQPRERVPLLTANINDYSPTQNVSMAVACMLTQKSKLSLTHMAEQGDLRIVDGCVPMADILRLVSERVELSNPRKRPKTRPRSGDAYVRVRLASKTNDTHTIRPDVIIPPLMKHCVYLIGSAGLFKIGQADNLMRRIRTLANQSSVPIELIAVHALGSRADMGACERMAHMLLHDKRQHGEWFLCSELAATQAVLYAAEAVKRMREPDIIDANKAVFIKNPWVTGHE